MNMTVELQNWLTHASADDVTGLFLRATLVVLVVSLWQGYKGRHSQFLEYAPTLMTSLGILGTFVGVVIGLLHFDTSKIDESIPALLEGLKTAFLTSIFGMTAAMMFNVLDAWLFAPKRASTGVNLDITPRDIFHVLEEQKAILSEVVKGLSGQEEGSLVGQLKFLRQGVTDFQKQHESRQIEFSARLWKELEGFADMLSRSATAQIIEALEKVIRDFNKNLTEQFGDNFKRLDESVKKLVDWQAAYKDQVEKMGEQYQQSVDSLVHTRTAVAGIWEECKEIPLAMAELREVLQVNQHQIAELQRHLEAFVSMRDAAVQAVPTIQQRVEEVGALMVAGATGLQSTLNQTGQKMLENSNKMQVALSEGAVHFRDSVTQTQQSFADMSRSVSASSEKLAETLEDAMQDMHNSAREVLDNMRKAVDEMGGQLQRHSGELSGQFGNVIREVERNSQQLVSNIGQTGTRAQQLMASMMEQMQADLVKSISRARSELDNHVSDSVKAFAADANKKLELFEISTMRQLNAELETMGGALTSVTGRFVEDYQRLVTAMDKIVRSQPGRIN